jgi:hypothetical protein
MNTWRAADAAAREFLPQMDQLRAICLAAVLPSRVNIVASEDRTVHPDLERFVAKRMGATTTELKSSHVPMLSQPGAVLDVIHQAVAAVVAKQG